MLYPKPWKIKKRKWKIAKFSPKTKQEIFQRDWGRCIFCTEIAVNAHHVYFGTESNYKDNRNDLNQWISVCLNCHLEIHWCWIWEGKREQAVNYLKNKLWKIVN